MRKTNLIQFHLMIAALFGGMGGNQKTSAENISGEKYKNIPRGCRVFTIDGVDVIALNEKNAIRKAKRRR